MVWRDPFAFYGNILKYGEFSPRAHSNLGFTYMHKHDYAAAIAEFRTAIKLTDTFAETRYDRVHLARSFKCARDLDTEVAQYRRARLCRVVVEKNVVGIRPRACLAAQELPHLRP